MLAVVWGINICAGWRASGRYSDAARNWRQGKKLEGQSQIDPEFCWQVFLCTMLEIKKRKKKKKQPFPLEK